MAPDVLSRKLNLIRQLLLDLAPYRNATVSQVIDEHYKIERILELLATAASDILFHLLNERGLAPDSYRDAFRLSGEQGIIPVDLARNLEDAAGMRNVLAHLYERIDYTILHQSIEPALHDFGEFVNHLQATLDDLV